MPKTFSYFGLLALLVAGCVPGLAEDPLRVGQDQALRAVSSKTSPVYSQIARQLKIEGDVKVDVSITEEGAVDNIAVVSGNPVLLQCVKDAVKHWKFAPFKVDGKAAKAITTLSFSFKL